MPPERLAFLGTGLMGGPMAMRLRAAGSELTVWNRSVDKTVALARAGASVAATPAEAAVGASILFLMLTDGHAVEEALFASGAAAALAPGALVIDMSSIRPERARAHAERLAALGHGHCDAPVSGGTRGAAEGSLAIMVGGGTADVARAAPLLTLLGRALHVGPAGSGQLAKLANQIIVAITIGAVAEALLFAAAGGADPARVREALAGGFADSPVLAQHGARMISRDWRPGGPLRLQKKDLDAVAAATAELGLDLPMTGLVTRLVDDAVADGLDALDHSALLRAIERRNPGRRLGNAADWEPRQ